MMSDGSDSLTYELVDAWAQLPSGESFVDACKVAVDEDDHVWILNRGDQPVMEFDSEGNRLDAWGADHFSDRPHGMTIGPGGDLYCTDDLDHAVRRFQPDGTLVETLQTPESPTETGYQPAETYWEQVATIARSAGPFNRPTGVAVTPSGSMYVADGYGNARIHTFDAERTLTGGWGEPGANPGEFRVPHAVELHDGQVWVADRENSRVQIFDDSGKFIDEWVDLIRPTDIAFHDGKVYVSEFACRVSVFDESGDLLTRWGNDPGSDDRLFVAPHSIAVDSHGDVYVGEVAVTYGKVDRGARTVRKFSPA